MPTYNTNIQTATGGSSTPGRLIFSEPTLNTGHPGTYLRVYDTTDARWRVAAITAVTGSQIADVIWANGDAMPIGRAAYLWEEQAISAARGFARSVCIHQQRLVLGGVASAGSALFFSKPGQFRDFRVGTGLDGDGIAVLAAGGLSNIRHVLSGQQLTVFTDKEVSFIPLNQGQALTPSTIRLQRAAPHGVADAPPREFDDGILMVQRGGTVVRDVAYSSEAENLLLQPVNITSTRWLGTLVDMAVLAGSDTQPEQLAFGVTADGRIGCYHGLRAQRLSAWTEWRTDGEFYSVGAAGQRLFVAVKRTGTNYDLEVFDPDLPFDSVTDWDYVAGPTPATTPFAASRFATGKVVHVVDDTGSYLGEGPIVAGAATITSQLPEIPSVGSGRGYLGQAFDWRIVPNPPAVDLPDGSLVQRVQRTFKASVLLLDAFSMKLDGRLLVLLKDGDLLDAQPPARSGWWTASRLGWSRRDENAALPVITRAVPLFAAVLALKREVKA
jgi:hypothetical protein